MKPDRAGAPVGPGAVGCRTRVRHLEIEYLCSLGCVTNPNRTTPCRREVVSASATGARSWHLEFFSERSPKASCRKMSWISDCPLFLQARIRNDLRSALEDLEEYQLVRSDPVMWRYWLD